MMGWMEAQGLKRGAPTRAVYAGDPDTTPEDPLRTGIHASRA